MDYKLNITDSSNPEKSLVYLENEFIDQDIFLATRTNDVTIEVTGKVIHPKYFKHLKKLLSTAIWADKNGQFSGRIWAE